MRHWYLGKRQFTFDILAAIIVAAAFVLLALRDQQPILELICKDETALYGSFLAALTALLGFAIAAVAIIASLVTGRAFKRLRHSDTYESFWGAFTWSIKALAIANLMSFLGLFVGRYNGLGFGTLVAVVGAIALAALSLIRSGYTLDVVLRMTKDIDKLDTTTVTKYDKA